MTIARAVDILKQGGVVVCPTETAYGLAADATNARAIAKIFAVKGRSGHKPLPLIAGSSAMAERFFRFTKEERALARQFWPGPLTILLRPRQKFPRGVAGRDGRVAVRVSGSVTARALAQRLGKPITATSANRSGGKTCYSISCVRASLRGFSPELVISRGTLPRRRPSTIVRINKNSIKILRLGSITL